MKEKIVFLTGPTAVGKTEIAVALAKKINGEIVSCDSMQVYKKMPIISNQPDAFIRKTVPYHLTGIISPSKEYNVSIYRESALKKIREIIKRSRTPIFTGGTGLYMSVVIDGIFEIETENKFLRETFYRESEKNGSLYLHNKLKMIDSLSAKKIHPNDTKRIIRALEVFEATGMPISLLQEQRRGLADEYDVKISCINIDKELLYKRIEDRVTKMFASGLVNEVKTLLKMKLSRTASQAIGINEIKGYLNGEYDLAEAKRKIIHNTRRYAKRQLTWFRKDKRIKWIDICGNDTVPDIERRIRYFNYER